MFTALKSAYEGLEKEISAAVSPQKAGKGSSASAEPVAASVPATDMAGAAATFPREVSDSATPQPSSPSSRRTSFDARARPVAPKAAAGKGGPAAAEESWEAILQDTSRTTAAAASAAATPGTLAATPQSSRPISRTDSLDSSVRGPDSSQQELVELRDAHAKLKRLAVRLKTELKDAQARIVSMEESAKSVAATASSSSASAPAPAPAVVVAVSKDGLAGTGTRRIDESGAPGVPSTEGAVSGPGATAAPCEEDTESLIRELADARKATAAALARADAEMLARQSVEARLAIAESTLTSHVAQVAAVKAELEQSDAAHHAQAETAAARNHEMEQQLAALDKAAATLRDEAHAAATRAEQAHKAMEEAAAAHDKAAALSNCEEQRLRDSLQTAECRLIELTKDLHLAQQHSTAAAADQQAQAAVSESELAQLREAVAASEHRVAELTDELRRLHAGHGKERDETAATIAALRKQLDAAALAKEDVGSGAESRAAAQALALQSQHDQAVAQLREQLASVETQVARAAAQHGSEMSALKSSHEAAIAALQAAHELALATAVAGQQVHVANDDGESDESLAQMAAKHAVELSALKSDNVKAIQQLDEKHAQTLLALGAEHEAITRDMQSLHDAAIRALESKHTEALNAFEGKQVVTLQTHVDEHQAAIVALDKKHSDAIEQLDTSHRAAMAAATEAHGTAIKALETRVAEADEKAKAASQQVANLEQRLSGLAAAEASASDAGAELGAQITQLRDELSAAHVALTEERRKHASAIETLEQVHSEKFSQLQSCSARDRAALEAAGAEQARQAAARDKQAEQALAEARAAFDKATAEKKDLSSKVAKLERDHVSAMEQVHSTLGQTQGDLSAVREKFATAEQQRNDLQSQCQSLRDKMAAMAMLELEFSDGQRAAKDLQQELSTANATIKQLRDTVSQTEHALAEARSAIRVVEQARKEEDEKTNRIKALLVKTKKELAEARQAVTDREATEVSLRTQLETKQQAFEDLQLDAARGAGDASRATASLREQVQSLTDQLDAAQVDLRQRAEDAAAKAALVASLQAEFQAYKTKAQSVLKQRHDTQPQVDELRAQIESLTSALEASKKREAESAANRAGAEKDQEAAMEREAAALRERDTLAVQLQSRATQQAAGAAEQETRHRDALRRQREEHETASRAMQQQLDEQGRVAVAREEELASLIADLRATLQARDEALAQVSSTRSRELIFAPSSSTIGGAMDAAGSDATATPAKAQQDLASLLMSSSTSGTLSSSTTTTPGPAGSDAALRRQMDHMRTLLGESEANIARMIEEIKVLKGELRRVERNEQREQAGVQLEYLKNVVLKYMLGGADEQERLVAAIATVLAFSPVEVQSVRRHLHVVPTAAGAATGSQTWGTFLQRWTAS